MLWLLSVQHAITRLQWLQLLHLTLDKATAGRANFALFWVFLVQFQSLAHEIDCHAQSAVICILNFLPFIFKSVCGSHVQFWSSSYPACVVQGPPV